SRQLLPGFLAVGIQLLFPFLGLQSVDLLEELHRVLDGFPEMSLHSLFLLVRELECRLDLVAEGAKRRPQGLGELPTRFIGYPSGGLCGARSVGGDGFADDAVANLGGEINGVATW